LSVNTIVPIIEPVAGAVRDTVAVYVTVCPTTAGFADDVVTVVVAAAFTTCERDAEVLVAKFTSPAYTAVSACVDADANVVTQVAIPPLSS